MNNKSISTGNTIIDKAGQNEMKRNHYRQKRCLLNTVHRISLRIYHSISNNKSSIQESITSFK